MYIFLYTYYSILKFCNDCYNGLYFIFIIFWQNILSVCVNLTIHNMVDKVVQNLYVNVAYVLIQVGHKFILKYF